MEEVRCIKMGNNTIRFEKRTDGRYLVLENYDMEYKINNIEGD